MPLQNTLQDTIKKLDEEFYEKFRHVQVVKNEISGNQYGTFREYLHARDLAIIEAAKAEEASRWINQPANEHDNKIRLATLEAVRERIKSFRPKGDVTDHNTYNDGRRDLCDDLLSDLK
jgi:hypothetical protein